MLFKNIKIKIIHIIPILSLLFVVGCIPQKEIVYLQNKDGKHGYENKYVDADSVTEKYILRPNDALFIHVSTSNTKLSEYFNPSRSGSSSSSSSTSSLYTYPIDDYYNIEFPFVGKINLENCNRNQARMKIIDALKPFLADAQVTVRLSSPSFIALGEIRSPGRVAMGKDVVTIYEAVALAGDVQTFGRRKYVKIVRPKEDTFEIFYVDLTDKNILGSDRYYVYPNDLIYISAMKAKSFGIGESLSFGILTSTVALYFTISSLINSFKPSK